jgi:hypothetical protein
MIDIDRAIRICDQAWWGDPDAELARVALDAELDALGVPTGRQILEMLFATNTGPSLDHRSP